MLTQPAIEQSHYQAAAILHQESITTGFLSHLGLRFLVSLYKGIAVCPYSCLFVSLDDNKNVTGFIAGSTDTAKMYKWILIRKWPVFCVNLAPVLFKPGVVKRIFETVAYPGNKREKDFTPSTLLRANAEVTSARLSAGAESQHPAKAGDRKGREKSEGSGLAAEPPSHQTTQPPIKAELLSIAVSESARGKGIGKALVQTLEKYFAEHGVEAYKVVTFSQDPGSNAFYQSCGFTLDRQFSHHGNGMKEYIKGIKG